MNERENALRQRLLATFKVEAQEHLAALSTHLLNLEKISSRDDASALIESAFRESHSLKGASRIVNFSEIERVCQAMENVFSAMKRGSLGVTNELLDILLRAVRLLEQVQTASETGSTMPTIAPMIEVLKSAAHSTDSDHSEEVISIRPAVVSQESPPPTLPADRSADMVRVPTEKLDAVRIQAEELLEDKLTSAQLAADLQHLCRRFADWRKQWTKTRGETRGLQSGHLPGFGPAAQARQLARLSEFLEWNVGFMESIDHRLSGLTQTAWQNHRLLAGKTDGLLDDTRDLLLMPCSWLFDGMQRVVRDLARDQNKEVELIIEGGDIEIDRRILTEIKDPLIHILRNCIDHGIEPGVDRQRAGKPHQARVHILIAPLHGNRVEISVSDDGQGVKLDKLKTSAIKLGILDSEQAEQLKANEVLDLIFRSAVTTSPIVTDLSGRGLGLAITREKVEKLGGAVSLENRPGKGTTLRMVLPLSLATFRGVVVREGTRFFVVPTVHVERVLRVKMADIRTVENRETISFAGETTAVVRLQEVLGLPATTITDTRLPALAMKVGEHRIVFLLEEICQEQEVLVKSLGPMLQDLPGISGATVLGMGKVAPILDGAELIRTAIQLHELGTAGSVLGKEHDQSMRKRSILVVEDSITSRTLLRNILESSGFQVQTAVDGIDGIEKMHANTFDLVVSDVDMPRLNGLELTARIRATQKWNELPVVLVTSMDSREDRERGIEVGANAYIVKSSFEQSNLLEVIHRLI